MVPWGMGKVGCKRKMDGSQCLFLRTISVIAVYFELRAFIFSW